MRLALYAAPGAAPFEPPTRPGVEPESLVEAARRRFGAASLCRFDARPLFVGPTPGEPFRLPARCPSGGER